MAFIDPVLALCTDRRQRASENPRVQGPDFWLSALISRNSDYRAISFDYFIDWTVDRLDRDLWLKCPIDAGALPDWKASSDEEIAALLRRNQRFRTLVEFCRCNRASASAVIFDDSQDWSSDASELVVARWPRESGQGLDIRRLARPDLEALIRCRSGGPVKIGSKGLFYATSRLECHLSTTNALWPGDADLLICETKSMRPVALVEYKKHTGRSRIGFRDQKLSNYYPKPDARKYDRLALLSEQIVAGSRIDFFVIYHSTSASELGVTLEQIVGTKGDLKSGRVASFQISPSDPEVGYAKLLESICASAQEKL